MEATESLGGDIGAVADKVGPAVIGRGRGWDVGSGFVLAEGRVVVSVAGLRSDHVTVAFADGRREAGELLGADAELGLGVVGVQTGTADAPEWAAAADGGLRIGTPVIALGSPGGRGLRATLGFVASHSGSFRGPRGRRVGGGIEHTAPLPRGSSGGPLVDLRGRLVGINLVRVSEGLILALPADRALRERLDALAAGASLPARTLGVAVAPPRVARRMRHAVGLPERDGILVRAVEEGSAADRAGLRRGDLIAAAAGRPVDGVDVLHEALEAVPESGSLSLTVVRGTEEEDVSVRFEETGAEEV